MLGCNWFELSRSPGGLGDILVTLEIRFSDLEVGIQSVPLEKFGSWALMGSFRVVGRVEERQ